MTIIKARASIVAAVALAAACAAAVKPRDVTFSYPSSSRGTEFALRARIGSYEAASEAIADALQREPGFTPFAATLSLYPDIAAFEAALVSVGYERPFARQTAGVMAAVGGHRRVLINEARLSGHPWAERVGLIAHELTHTFQYELGGGRRGASDQWLREGFAEWVSMRVLDRLRLLPAGDYRRQRRRQLRATDPARAPRLEEMVTFPQLVALATRRDIAPYAQAFLAVDLLVERHGAPAVIRYFQLFATSDDRRANFSRAFGESLAEFEAVAAERLWRPR